MTGGPGGLRDSEPTTDATREEPTVFPAPDQVVRGLALAGLAVALLGTAGTIIRRAGLPGWPPAGLLTAASFLSAWAALIHLTGGERFDDHPLL